LTDADGRPLQAVVSAGNENERPYLLPLLDALPDHVWTAFAAQVAPSQVYADRGYDSLHLNDAIAARGLEPRISRRQFHRKGDPQPKPKRRDPLGRKRWPIERTNAWLMSWRRVQTRWERRSDLYTGIVQLVVIVLLLRFDLA
jgi:transposase